MSFYLGKNGTSPIMHLTTNVHSELEMQTGTYEDTAFHSSLKYISYSIYPCTVVSNTSFYVSSEYITDFDSAKTVFFVVNGIVRGLNLVRTATQLLYKAGPDGYPSESDTVYPTAVNKYLAIQTYFSNDTEVALSTVSIVVIGIGCALGDFIQRQDFNEALGISVNSSALTVSGVNLASLKYISTQQINTRDLLISSGTSRSFQLINSNNTSTTCSLVVAGGEKAIYSGGVKIFDYSIVSNSCLYSHSEAYMIPSITFTVYSTHVATYYIPTGKYLSTTRFTIVILWGMSLFLVVGGLPQQVLWYLGYIYVYLAADGQLMIKVIAYKDPFTYYTAVVDPIPVTLVHLK